MDKTIAEYKKYFKLKNGYEVDLKKTEWGKVAITVFGKTTEHTEDELKQMIANLKTYLP